MKVRIISLNGLLWQGEAKKVILPTKMGQISVLDNHFSLLSFLDKGKVIIEIADQEKKEFQVEKGFLKVNKNEVDLLI